MTANIDARHPSAADPTKGVADSGGIIGLFGQAKLIGLVEEAAPFFLPYLDSAASAGIEGWQRHFGDSQLAEQFAQAFETYVYDGKAPAADLYIVFEKFRGFLLAVYQELSGNGLPVAPELRAIFDRMLVSDMAIATERADLIDQPAFSAPDAIGLTPEAFAALDRLRQLALAEARAKLLGLAMAPLRAERAPGFAAERARARAEIEPEVNGRAVYRAREWLGNQRWLGADRPEDLPPLRLSRRLLVERYGEAALAKLPRGRQAIYADEGGLDPDAAAGWFGYGSGDELVEALATAPDRQLAIETATDLLLRMRRPDIMTDGTLRAHALDALHNEVRARVLARESQAIAAICGAPDQALTPAAARAEAQGMLARMKLRDAVVVGRFIAAERKAGASVRAHAGKLAASAEWLAAAQRIASGGAAGAALHDEDAKQLLAAKRRQLLNHMLYVEARHIAEEAAAAEALARQFGSAAGRAKLPPDYLSAIDELLERYELQRQPDDAPRAGGLLAYTEAMAQEGRANELSIAADVLAGRARISYRELTIEGLRGVVGSLRNIAHAAARRGQLVDADGTRDLDLAVGEILGALTLNLPAGDAAASLPRPKWGRHYLDLGRNAEAILYEIDGVPFGPAYQQLKQPIDLALARLGARRRLAAEALAQLYTVYSPAERRQMAVREWLPALGRTLTKWQRLVIALNAGNAACYRRLTDLQGAGHFTEAQVTAILATLDARDAGFVQSVWEYLGGFRTEIAARERRATGVAPEWGVARPLTIGGLGLAGGSYPLAYAPAGAVDVAEALAAGSFAKAWTRDGELRVEAEAAGRGLSLDIAVLHREANRLLCDLALSEAVANSGRLLQDARLRQAFGDAGRAAELDALEAWLKVVAEGGIIAVEQAGAMARRFDMDFTLAQLLLDVAQAGLACGGVAAALAAVGGRDFLGGVVTLLGRDANSLRSARINADEIGAKSGLMRTRQALAERGAAEAGGEARLGQWLLGRLGFYAVDVPAWLGAYGAGLTQFDGDEAQAIAYADAVVAAGQRLDPAPFIERWRAAVAYVLAKAGTGRNGGAVPEQALAFLLDNAQRFAFDWLAIAAMTSSTDDANWPSFVAETALALPASIPFIRDIDALTGGSAAASLDDFVGQRGAGEIDGAVARAAIEAATQLANAPRAEQLAEAGWRRSGGGRGPMPLEHVLARHPAGR